VQDRPSRSHEYLFLLSKSPRYFYDREAIAEDVSGNAHHRGNGATKPPAGWNTGAGSHATIEGRYPQVKANGSFPAAARGLVETRNKRSVWEIATQPYPNAHYATFPEALVEPCILAGTSEVGCCPACGAPWLRATAVEYVNPGNRTTNGPRAIENHHITAGYTQRLVRRVTTLGWEPSCSCDAGEPVPATVFDPFAGTSTVGVLRRGRSFLGIELNPESVRQSRARIEGAAPLFNIGKVEVIG
jgi:hypothetical protein